MELNLQDWVHELCGIMLEKEYFDVDRDDVLSAYWEWNECFKLAWEHYDRMNDYESPLAAFGNLPRNK